MDKRLLILLKFVFENGPNIGFWLGILYFLRGWYLQQNIFIKLVFIGSPLVIISFVVFKSFRKVKNQLLEVAVESGLREQKKVRDRSAVELMIKNLPSKQELLGIHEYAAGYAKSWASDGELLSINYYLDLDGESVKKDAQIFIRSQIRKERLAFYLPRRTRHIEELDESASFNEPSVRSIYSFEYWKEAITKALENSTSDIEKSDSARLQISPGNNLLHINITFSKGDREWKSRYVLKESSLEKGSNVVFKFG